MQQLLHCKASHNLFQCHLKLSAFAKAPTPEELVMQQYEISLIIYLADTTNHIMANKAYKSDVCIYKFHNNLVKNCHHCFGL